MHPLRKRYCRDQRNKPFSTVLAGGVSIPKYKSQQNGFRLAISKKLSGTRTQAATVTNLK